MLISRAIWFKKGEPYPVICIVYRGAEFTGTLPRFPGLNSTHQNEILLGLITRGNMYAVHPGTRCSRMPCDRDTVTVHCAGLTIGAYCWGNTYAFLPRDTPLHRVPCDRDTVTVHCAGLTIGAYCWGNTYAFYPGTHRSRSPCDRNTVTVHCAGQTATPGILPL